MRKKSLIILLGFCILILCSRRFVFAYGDINDAAIYAGSAASYAKDAATYASSAANYAKDAATYASSAANYTNDAASYASDAYTYARKAYMADTLEEAQYYAKKAMSDAEDAESLANNAKSAAEDAESSANNAKSAAENAESSANDAKSAAENAESSANDAESADEDSKIEFRKSENSARAKRSKQPRDITTADLLRVKRNVQKMARMGAPSSEIELYISACGYTPEEVRQAGVMPEWVAPIPTPRGYSRTETPITGRRTADGVLELSGGLGRKPSTARPSGTVPAFEMRKK
ncbi:MAG: hypothetical protein U9Q24_00445 [Candidatus Ratteibacteria bacterium]|nr:hypothetical protein [Candidatus Ratteibacteria bacterium]